MTTSVLDPPQVHPLRAVVVRLHAVLDTVGEVPVAAMPGAEIAETLADLHRAIARLVERELALVAAADRLDVASEAGCTGSAEWLRALTNLAPGRARAMLRDAVTLDAPDHDRVRTALAAGRLDAAQARVVADAVDALPGWVGPQLRAEAERHLVDEATRLDAQALAVAGRHLLDVVDPDGADRREAERLAEDERRAARDTTLSMHDDGKGRCTGEFTIPSRFGAILECALDAIANPALAGAVPRTDGQGRKRLGSDVRGEAFCRFLERYPVDRLPESGGSTAAVVVTIPAHTLHEQQPGGTARADGEAPATVLGTDIRVSPGEARRWACAAGVLPAVLDGDSTVLDLGRRHRLHTAKQRLAMALQQEGRCAVEGCERPTSWCDAHHVQPWSRGGGTSVVNGVLICPRHHTLAHDHRFEVALLAPGRVTLRRRT